jgi:hypothetical protein
VDVYVVVHVLDDVDVIYVDIDIYVDVDVDLDANVDVKF